MIVEGINVVRELIKADKRVDKVIVEKSENKDLVKLTDMARSKGIKVEIVVKQTIERINKGKTQGILAFVPNFKYSDVEDILFVAENFSKILPSILISFISHKFCTLTFIDNISSIFLKDGNKHSTFSPL